MYASKLFWANKKSKLCPSMDAKKRQMNSTFDRLPEWNKS